ncbi:unnamed protein product [Ambrosiozyma monospora]|uniref:Unnamed protein product n=1 Tax=Ambrosiozyma monospora TaxID=43982 RepID=A0ACB5UB13_AMBMO|nr:unnamed protein product [Ambrosiozyma monospora]
MIPSLKKISIPDTNLSNSSPQYVESSTPPLDEFEELELELELPEAEVTISRNTSTIINGITTAAVTIINDKPTTQQPFINGSCSLSIRVIASVSSQSSTDMEQTRVRNRVFVIVTFIPSENLPS